MSSPTMTDELARIEALALDLYSPASSPTVRSSARLSLTPVALSPSFLLHCHELMQRSSSPEALLFACNTLYELISSHFNKLTIQDTLSLQQSIITLLTSPSQPQFVRSVAIRLLCRLTKLAWLQNNEHRRVFESAINPILSHQTQLGLQILDELIVEFFTNTSTMLLVENRRIASNFRVAYLHDIACIAAKSIPDKSVRLYAIRVLCRALTAHATVSLQEESLEHGGSLMLSEKWAETIAHPRMVDNYAILCVEAPETIEILATMARIRRSLWANDERSEWVKAMMRATQTLARQANVTIATAETEEIFAQLLMNLKMTFQLTDFVALPDFSQWLSAMADITIMIWTRSGSGRSTLPLLKFWSGVAKARRNPPSSAPEYEADRQIARLALRYLDLQCEAHYSAEAEDLNAVEEELDCYAVMFHHACSAVLSVFHGQFEKALRNQASECLSWIAALSTQIVAQQKTPSCGELRGGIDASITFRILQLLQEPCLLKDRKTQIHVVLFLDEIRHTYFSDSSRIFSANQQAASNAFFAHLTDLCSRKMTMDMLVTLLIPAIGRLVSVFCTSDLPEEQAVAEEAADLIVSITAGPAGQNVLNHCRIADIMLPLTEKTSALALRTKLAACLSHSLISNCPEDVDDSEHITGHCNRLFQTRLHELSACQVVESLKRIAVPDLIALFCDLNGMAHAVQAHAKFHPFWLFLEPHMPIFVSLMPHYTSLTFRKSILKLLRTMTNHNTVDPFGPVSSSGLRLVKSIAPILRVFAESAVQRTEAGSLPLVTFQTASPREAGSPLPSPVAYRNQISDHEDGIECLETYFDIVSGILSGSWVQTGVMKLYGDATACNLISQSLAVAFHGTVSFKDLLSIPGTKRAVVQLFTILSELYADQLMNDLNLEDRSALFQNLLVFSLELRDYTAIDCLSSLLRAPSLIPELLAFQAFEMLLDSVLFESVDITKMSRPLFPLVFRKSGDFLSLYRSRMVEANPSNERAIITAFDELTKDLYFKMSPTKSHLSSFSENICKARTTLNKAGIYSSSAVSIK